MKRKRSAAAFQCFVMVRCQIGDDMSAFGKHFVMMYSQSGSHAMPILDGNGEVELFITVSDAHASMQNHPYAQSFGYEVFCMGEGEAP